MQDRVLDPFRCAGSGRCAPPAQAVSKPPGWRPDEGRAGGIAPLESV